MCCLPFLFVVILYNIFEVNYFLRMAFVIVWERLFSGRNKIFDPCINYGMCLSTDVDIFLKHMNNARYIRELDFARSYYYDRSGIFREITRLGGSVVQGATSIRYRRPIPIFTTYKITTKLIYWDNRNIYIEHDFVSLSDSFVRATVLSKQTVTGTNINVPDIIEKLEPGAIRPKPSDELKLWLVFIDESSLKFKRMREKDDKTEVSSTSAVLENSS